MHGLHTHTRSSSWGASPGPFLGRLPAVFQAPSLLCCDHPPRIALVQQPSPGCGQHEEELTVRPGHPTYTWLGGRRALLMGHVN